METLTIDCDECTMRDTDTCGGCVVIALCGQPGGVPVRIEAAEARAVWLLSAAGLVPPLLHLPVTACA